MIKNVRFAVPLLLLFLVASCVAAPKWYTQDTAGTGMFTGSGSAKVEDRDEGKALAKAKQAALHDACSSVFCDVSGQTTMVQKETNADMEDLFVSETAIRTAVEAVNVKVLKQTVAQGVAYVSVGIPRDDLQNAYRLRIRTTLKQVTGDFELAEGIRTKRPRVAITTYERCMSGIGLLAEDLKVYLFLNDWENDLAGEIERVVSVQRVETRLAGLSGKTPKRPDDLAEDLLRSLLPTQKTTGTFVIYPMEYESTGFVSSFGHSLTELLAGKISNRTGWRRREDVQGVDTVFRGKILTTDKGIYIVLSMREVDNETTSQVYVSEATCKSITWERIRPKDLDKALKGKLELYKEIKTDAGLRIQLQTDRMSDGPVVYRYGDRPKLALKVNRACYVRLIYTFSDGTPTLLLDNQRFSSDMANEWQRLPVNWEVCAPPGVEQMLVQATVDEKMPPLNIKRQNLAGGYYQDIIMGSVGESVMRTRGGKLFKSDPILTEKAYQWTIFEE
ncbi:MAG: hypothetical protein QGH42_01570 [Kiritimatiellia bacterium]|nr:hypothetical protein [Kiritimatiellia bacterium]